MRHRESINLGMETARREVLESLNKIISEDFSMPVTSIKVNRGIFRLSEMRDGLRKLVKNRS